MAAVKSVCVAAIVVLSLLASLEASPVSVSGGTSDNLRIKLRSFLDAVGLKRSSPSHHLVTRQTVTVSCDNTNTSTCLKNGTLRVPPNLVTCVGGDTCICNECFVRDAITGLCIMDTQCPTQYFFSDGTCVDERPSQLVAFLLSIFISSTGAANFYIGRDELGAGQIALLLITILVPYVMCYLPCCMACCISKDEIKGSIPFILIMLLTVIILLLATFAIMAWWIADLVIFAKNDRLAGSGCMLRPTL